jgi:hypothetical protein
VVLQTRREPARWCSPSTFWVMIEAGGGARARTPPARGAPRSPDAEIARRNFQNMPHA